MTDYPLTWLNDILLAAGLKVAEVPGWQTRGLNHGFDPKGVVVHHTGGPAMGNMPSLGIVTNGRPDLTGPLSQLGLGRDGTFYCIAAGFAQHAGPGAWHGITTGNTSFVGIESENTGLPVDLPWPDVQIDALRRGIAAILTRLGAPAIMCCGHKEWALPKGRKTDPLFDMDSFRAAVAQSMAGTLAPRPPIALVDAAGRQTLRRGATGESVETLQRLLGVPVDGAFGPGTEAIVRAFQTRHHIVPDGIVGPASWAILSPS
ncbi:N-acetylmuramoyl-L-alanine amidase [uncultured Sphingomonas sp.]|uniref:peptidoglycan recognition protein family protein n=1 Tax=uncultured Sphingomonas sp. TaxID=158754 RepID=UPI0035CC8FAC